MNLAMGCVCGYFSPLVWHSLAPESVLLALCKDKLPGGIELMQGALTPLASLAARMAEEMGCGLKKGGVARMSLCYDSGLVYNI